MHSKLWYYGIETETSEFVFKGT